MPSFLQGSLAKSLARGFKGKLKTGVIQENQAADQDDFGDAIPPTNPATHSFTGMRSNFDAAWRERAMIKDTDVMIMILLASVQPAYQPLQDDLILLDAVYYKVRRVLKIDPASATIELQCYVVPTPGTCA